MLTAQHPWGDVVNGEFLGGELPSAVLAPAAVARVEIAAIEFDFLARQTVVPKQADDLRDRDVNAGRPYPGMSVRFELPLEFGDLGPGFEVVVDILTVLDRDHLRGLLAEHDERSASTNHANRRIQAVQDQYLFIEDQRDRRHPNLQLSFSRKVRFGRMVVNPIRLG